MHGFGRSLALALFLLPLEGAQAAAVNPAPPAYKSANERADPCLPSVPGKAAAPATPQRAKISRQAAIYVVHHIHNACRIIVSATSQGSPLEAASQSLTSIRGDLYVQVLTPIFRSHPDLKTAKYLPPDKVYRATTKDINRTTATWLVRDLSHIEQSVFKQVAEKPITEDANEALADVIAELSFATKVVGDAYPDVWMKQVTAVAPQPGRTAESDAAFRKTAIPPGSVKLTASAAATIKSFMRQVRVAMPNDDSVATIGWTTNQRSKSPEDKSWANIADGWGLGAFSRSQVPPELIDKVDGLEIIFTADSPSRLAGKTVDFQKGNFIVRD